MNPPQSGAASTAAADDVVHRGGPAVGSAGLRGRGTPGRLMLLGPAFVAAIAYVDPGNFATNFSAGSKYGYLLL
ncbi:MAG: hypothetical protein M3R63_00685, partial [Actinomycetota bacterium]|nr:hypothetical protein [Actinomycetota bacterium]